METLSQSNDAPTLIEFLKAEYLAAMQEHEDEGVDKVELSAGAEQFCEFALAYLTDNRPRGSYPSDDNIGITLSNGRRVLISPGVEVIHGTMAPIAGKTVDDTPGKMGSVGYTDQGAVPISGFARKPKHALDYSDKNYGKTHVDKTQTGVHKNYNPDTRKSGPVVDDPFNR
jgi:hypothetical protein